MILLFTFWKEDVFQKTLFYYSPTSTYRTVQHCTSFIRNNETDIILVTKYIEKKIGAKNLVLNDKYGKIIFTDTIIAMVKHIGFINGKKKVLYKGKYIDSYYQNELLDTIATYILPPDITRRMKNFGIANVLHDSEKIKCFSIYAKAPKTDSKTYFYEPYYKFYPRSRKDTPSYFYNESMRDYSKGFYLRYCSTANYIYGTQWTFKIQGLCFG